MLAVLLIVGGLIPQIHGVFTIYILSGDDVVTGRFLDSLLISLPPCSFYGGQNVDLEYTNCNTSKNYILTNIFTVPNCDDKNNLNGPTAHSRNIGYKLNNLSSGIQYKINYKIGSVRSGTVTATTRTANDYTKIKLGLPGRSAAMVVIVVILSVAAFILLINILIGLFVSPHQD